MKALVVINDVQQEQETSQFKLSPLRLCSSWTTTHFQRRQTSKKAVIKHQTMNKTKNKAKHNFVSLAILSFLDLQRFCYFVVYLWDWRPLIRPRAKSSSNTKVKKIDEVVLKEEETDSSRRKSFCWDDVYLQCAFQLFPSWPFKIFNRHWKKKMSGKAQSMHSTISIVYLFIYLFF